MQGELANLPLIGVLELIHFSRKTGLLEVRAPLPFSLTFVGGEITDGCLLDWTGLDAIFTLPPSPDRGQFAFQAREYGGPPLMPFAHLTTEWGRIADEWERACAVIGSPSRVLRGPLPGYEDGHSVRAVARSTGQSLFTTAQKAAEAVTSGDLELTDRFAWHALRLRHPRTRPGNQGRSAPLDQLMDGQRNLGDIIRWGRASSEVRSFLLRELQTGLRFPGAGWVLRDLTWETQYVRDLQTA